MGLRSEFAADPHLISSHVMKNVDDLKNSSVYLLVATLGAVLGAFLGIVIGRKFGYQLLLTGLLAALMNMGFRRAYVTLARHWGK